MLEGGEDLQALLKRFEGLCEMRHDIVQEMSDEGDILIPDVINLCLKRDIKFNSDFLRIIGSFNTSIGVGEDVKGKKRNFNIHISGNCFRCDGSHGGVSGADCTYLVSHLSAATLYAMMYLFKLV
jgi:hypothetical protein